jgi:hypothetical protein
MSNILISSRTNFTNMTNAAGKNVAPTMDTFQAAAANADFSKAKDILTNQPGERSWADYRGDLHAVTQGQPGRPEPGGVEVPGLGPEERSPAGKGARIRATTRRAREGHRGALAA